MRKKRCAEDEHVWEERAKSETLIYYKCALCGELRAVERERKENNHEHITGA